VDASTGKAKWVYQIVHHDVWDYDLPSQPVMYDWKNADGEKTPVLIQTSKTGNILFWTVVQANLLPKLKNVRFQPHLLLKASTCHRLNRFRSECQLLVLSH
jgi:Glucose dehydrogenase